MLKIDHFYRSETGSFNSRTLDADRSHAIRSSFCSPSQPLTVVSPSLIKSSSLKSVVCAFSSALQRFIIAAA